MPFSRTRPGDHGVLTDCPDQTATGLVHPGEQPGERGIARGTSRSAEAGSGTKSLRVPTHCRLSDENSRGKVQNVCGGSSVILLEGNRRTGKTSILKHLNKSPDLQGWVRVYCSFQSTEGQKGVAGVPTGEVFYSIARELILAVHEAGYACDIPGLGILNQNLSKASLRHSLLMKLHPLFEGAAPFEQFQIIVEAAISAVKPDRILLMLDEFDKLQEGIDHHITSPQLPENIRYLFHTYSELSGILTGSRRIKRLRDEYWSALFGIGSVISVTALDEHAARSLVMKPVEGRLVFAPAAVDRILLLTGRQPFLIQSLCARIFERCAASGESNVTTLTVDTAAEQLVADNEHFRTLWDYIKSDRRRFIVCLIDRLSGGPNKVTLSLIGSKLEEEGVPYPNELALVKDIDELRELEIIELKHDAYAVAVPLFSMWIHGAVDSSVCRLGALQEEAQ
jgi:type I restriction enzyme M protein